MRQCNVDLCYNRATFKMKITYNPLDKQYSSIRRFYLCDKCYNEYNPEHKRIIYESIDQEILNKMDMEGKEWFGKHYLKSTKSDQIVTFRRIIK